MKKKVSGPKKDVRDGSGSVLESVSWHDQQKFALECWLNAVLRPSLLTDDADADVEPISAGLCTDSKANQFFVNQRYPKCRAVRFRKIMLQIYWFCCFTSRFAKFF